MFISCPHCRQLVATHRQTGRPPAACPRCGGFLREADSAGAADEATRRSAPSFASYLRPDDEAAAAPATDIVATAVHEDADAGTDTDMDADSSADVGADAAEIVADDAAHADADVAEPANEASMLAPAAVEADMQDEPVAEASLPIVPPPARIDAELPSFTRQAAAARPSQAPKWQWALLVFLLLLLGLQVLLADRERLAADAAWRPMITLLCNATGCSVPAWRQPTAIAMLSRDVSPIPGSDGGLDVQATFRNDARWAQPWPVLLLSLSDADGRVLGSRAFTPAEYLGPAAATQTELAPGQSAQVALRLREPSAGVVAFSFDFR